MTIRAVHHLNCGTMCPLAGALLGSGRGLGRGRMVAHCLLIETERDGLILVDTGFGQREVHGHNLSRVFRMLAKPVLDPAETAIAQVLARGFRAADVRHIVVTHLDLDHAGGLADFPAAKVHVHAREHAAALAPATRFERERYVAAQWSHGAQWVVYAESGDTWRGLPAIARLRGLDADIGLLPMHGHTRGHSAVLVKAPDDRWLVHAGDAYFHRGTLEDGRVPLGVAAFERVTETVPADRRASAAALRQLRITSPDVDLFCAHDPREFDALVGGVN